jgi:succinylglutamate desuccinylase
MQHYPLSAYHRHQLYQVFLDWQRSSWQGIQGVRLIEGAAPGPSVGIMAMTHGNEPAGLAALDNLWQHRHEVKAGRVFLMVNNLGAGARYFKEATDLGFTAHFRFVDQDMNRMPEVLHRDSYELQRVHELLPIFSQLDRVLDLHSTSAASPPMLIEMDPLQPPLNVASVPVLIRNILPHLRGRALISLCEQAQGDVIECGSHEEAGAAAIAQQAAWQLLAQPAPEPLHPRHIYSVYRAVVFPDLSYRLQRILHSFEHLAAGTLLAEGEGPPLITESDSYVIMAPQRLQPVHPGSEFFYLASGPPATENPFGPQKFKT